MYRMHGAFGGLRLVEKNGSLTELALLRRCSDGLGRSFEVRIKCSHYGADGNRPLTRQSYRIGTASADKAG